MTDKDPGFMGILQAIGNQHIRAMREIREAREAQQTRERVQREAADAARRARRLARQVDKSGFTLPRNRSRRQ